MVRCAGESVQIHGGYGFIEEYPVCRLYCDAPRALGMARVTLRTRTDQRSAKRRTLPRLVVLPGPRKLASVDPVASALASYYY